MMTETVVNVQEAPSNNNAANKAHGGEPLGWIKINTAYFKTTPGILKLVEVLFGILCMALATPVGSTHFFLFVVTTSFIFTLIWIFVYFLGVREALNLPINWILTELLNTAIWTVLYLIAFIIQLSTWVPTHYYYYRGANIAAGVFGLFNTLVYGFATYLLYLEWKSNRTN